VPEGAAAPRMLDGTGTGTATLVDLELKPPTLVPGKMVVGVETAANVVKG